jgi:hypothetical protein
MKNVILVAVAWLAGIMFSGALASALHLPLPSFPQNASPAEGFAWFVLASLLLAAGTALAAGGLRGGFRARWLALGALLFICVGVNTAIEAVVFSSTIQPSQGVTLACMSLIPSVLAAAILARQPQRLAADPVAMPSFGSLGWSWRLIAAWLAFPVIYLFFGAIIAPFILDAYRQGIAGLRIPSGAVTLTTQLIRSSIFLAVVLPCVLLWNGSRRSLGIRLGLALAILIGAYGLVQATFFPVHLRIIHTLEIAADELAYAFFLAWLFRPAESKAAAPLPLGVQVTSL